MSEATPDREAIEQPGPPSAVVARDQRVSLAWLVLLGAAALAIGLLWTSWQERGLRSRSSSRRATGWPLETPCVIAASRSAR